MMALHNRCASRIRKTLLALSFAAIAAAPAAMAAPAHDSVACVDVNRLFQEMPGKKDADQRFQEANQAANAEMKQLQDAVNVYLRQKGRTGKVNQEKERLFGERDAQIRQNLSRKDQELYGPLKDRLRFAIEQVAKREGYRLVIDRISLAYADMSVDLTEKVSEEIGTKK